MNSKQSKILLKLITEEIDYYLFEQAPPADPTTTTPSDPNAVAAAPPVDATGNEDDEKDKGDDVKKKIDTLSKQSDEDIRKTILAKLQNGAEKKEVEDILRYVEANKDEKDPEKLVPKNVKKTVSELQKDFDIKTPAPEPKKPEKKQPAATGATSPVTESRLQKLAKEYLHYKKLYLRSQ